MKQLSLIISIILLLNIQFATAQDIFKQHGFDKKPLTLSNGRYNEFFNNDKIVQIGTVLLNTSTNQIIAFIEEDTVKATYLADLSSRWLSPDPHAEKYYNWSPYNYCYNNPVNIIDPDGRDGMLTGSGTKEDPYVIKATYFYQNGSMNQDEVNGLNGSAQAYNKIGGENGIKIKNEDGSTSFMKFDVSVQGVDNIDDARAGTQFTAADGSTRYYGNKVGTEPNKGGSGEEFGSANNYRIDINRSNVDNGVKNEGFDKNSLLKGVSIHEMGHNLGGEHSDGTATMDNVSKKTTTSQISSNGNNSSVSYTYPSLTANFVKILYNRHDAAKSNPGDGRIWTRKKE